MIATSIITHYSGQILMMVFSKDVKHNVYDTDTY